VATSPKQKNQKKDEKITLVVSTLPIRGNVLLTNVTFYFWLFSYVT